MSINKVTIVGIKGFKGSGKDTVASMISYILHDGIMKANYDTWLLYHKNEFVENVQFIRFLEYFLIKKHIRNLTNVFLG